MTAVELASRIAAIVEGFRSKAYWDAHGEVWTIGYGTTKGVKQGDTITREQARQRMAEEMAEDLYPLVSGLPLIEAAALMSFGYNVGSDDVERVLSGKMQVTEAGFFVNGERFGCVSGGAVLDGLVLRRSLESGLIIASRENTHG